MATPKLQNAYRNSSTQTDDIADLLLITTTGLATNADAGASFIVFNDGANDVLLSSATPLPVVAAATDVLLGTIDADTGAIATSAASIDTKTPALGQALAAASVPVVLTAAQISTLTPPAAITGFATESTLGTLSAKFASGTVIGDVNLGVTDNAVLDAIAASVAGTLTVGSHAVTNAGTFAVQASQSGTWNVTNISGTVSLPTGASTAAKQPALGTAGTASADVITVQGIASMTALKVDGSAVTQPVSGSVTANIGTVGTLATAANQTTGNTSLATIAGAVAGTEVQVDIVTMPNVTIAGTVTVGSHAVTNAGTFAVQVDGAALTSLQLLDDSVATTGSAITSKGMAAVGTDGTNARILKTDAAGELQIDVLTLPALAAGTNNIGDVDVLSLPSITGTVTVNAGTNTSTAALALESGGNLAAVATSLAALDNAVATNGTTALNQVIAVGGYNNNDGWINALQCDANGALYISAQNSIGVSAAGQTAHDGAISDPPLIIGGYASAAAPTSVSSDGDVTYVWCLRNGSPVVNLAVGGTLVTGSAGLPVAQQGTWNVATVTTLTGGGIAHDSADSGNPHKIGGKAKSTLAGITLVSADDRTDAFADVDGVMLTRPDCPLADIVTGNASNTDGSSTQCIAAQAAGVKTYLQQIILTNTSATPTYCEIKDGTTVKLTIPVPANAGATVTLAKPIGGTAATAWNFDPGAATTTMYCSMVGFKSKV